MDAVIQVEPQTPENRLALIAQWQADWESGGDALIGAFLDGEVVGSTGLHRRRAREFWRSATGYMSITSGRDTPRRSPGP